MATLKELRLQANMSQSQVGALIKVQHPQISNYEAGITLPDLEDCAILENYFDSNIEWQETLTPFQKHEVIQDIIELFEKHPIPMVCEFLARNYRRNQAPETFISHYAKVGNKESGGSLIPPNF